MNTIKTRRLMPTLVLLIALLIPPLPAHGNVEAADGGTWLQAGRFTIDRHELFTATALPDGTVLVAGGTDGAPDWPNPLDSADRYDPATNAWQPTGSMGIPRFWHTAAALADGRVVVIGGWSGEEPVPIARVVEAYDPASGTWQSIGKLTSARWWNTATPLPDGTLLVVGGIAANADGEPDLAGAERFDPNTGVARPTASPATPRYWHTATLLPDGTVLVVGGEDEQNKTVAAAERYDPRTDTWRSAGQLAEARAMHTATLLADGAVLVTGGIIDAFDAAPLASADVYNPATNSWRRVGSLNVRRYDHSAVLLSDGTVVAIGGHTRVVERYLPAVGVWVPDPVPSPLDDAPGQLRAVSLRDGSILAVTGDAAMRYLPGAGPAASPPPSPFAGAWQPAGTMTAARDTSIAAILVDGSALAVGGNAGDRASAERYDPAANRWQPAGALQHTRRVHAIVALPAGGALVLGSTPEPCPCVGTAERYDPNTGTWLATAPLPADFFLPVATILPDGTILVVTTNNRRTFRYDPSADAWRAVGDLPGFPGVSLALMTLPDGSTLLLDGPTVARYDLASSTWRAVTGVTLPDWNHVAALTDGSLLLVGRQESGIYTPVDATVHTASAMSADRGSGGLAAPYTLTALPGGLAMVVGGWDMTVDSESYDDRIPLASAEVYDLTARAWRSAAPLATARANHTAVALRDGSVLVFGGTALDGSIAPPERFVPGATPMPSPSPAAPSPGAGGYRITDLGPLVPVAINAAGQVAGTLPSKRAAIWRDGATSELAGDGGAAAGLNDRGWVVGSLRDDTGWWRAILWRDGAAIDLGTLGGRSSTATGVNGAGQIVGSSDDSSGVERAFRWQDGTMTRLDTDLGEPVLGTWATGINARGDIIGGMNKGEPVIWRDGHLSRLGTLAGWGGIATALNDAGQVVGATDTPSGQVHAVLWESGAVRDLGTLGGPGSEALDINSAGQIVGTARTATGAQHAFLHDPITGTLIDLNAALPPESGWVLTVAVGINDGGQIVGIGLLDGVKHGFLLTPVAPAGRYFPETGQTVGPPFLAYWEAHGGLAINGYPLSPAYLQTLEDGQPHLVQYFERVRLESHPENTAPYDILLGQFGRHILAGVPGAPTAPVPALPGATYFPETNHNVSRPQFLAYWQANGGLAQFGFPLSEEFVETLEDGQPYTVQYFERARFEWHPENAGTPYDVLLGQFGRRILGER